MNRPLVILGTSRPDGNTRMLVDAAFPAGAARIIDLADLVIAPYDYRNGSSADDFLAVARRMAEAPAIVFATPVYWYAMSAHMKTFVDRLTDLTKWEKPLGRSLGGKIAFLLATSASGAAPAGFEAVFAETARYFSMRWGGMLHAGFDEDRTLEAPVRRGAALFGETVFALAQGDVSLALSAP